MTLWRLWPRLTPLVVVRLAVPGAGLELVRVEREVMVGRVPGQAL